MQKKYSLGTFYKSLLFLIALATVACSANPPVTEIAKQPEINQKEVNNLSIYYYTMGEAALQEGNVQLAIQLYEKADSAAPENVMIKETILELMELSLPHDPAIIDQIIELGDKYMEAGISSEVIYNILANSYLKKGYLEKFHYILNVQIEQFPTMRAYLLKYYYKRDTLKQSDKLLLEKALNQDWKNINQVISIAMEYSEEPKEFIKIVEKGYQKWGKSKLTAKEIKKIYKEAGATLILVDLVESAMQNGEIFIDEINEFFISYLTQSNQYERVLNNIQYLVNSDSAIIGEMIFLSAVELENWEITSALGNSLYNRQDISSPKFVKLNTIIAAANLKKFEQALFNLTDNTELQDIAAILGLIYDVTPLETLDYFYQNIENIIEDQNIINLVKARIKILQKSYPEAVIHTQAIETKFIADNDIHQLISSFYLVAEKTFLAEELLSSYPDSTFSASEFIGRFYQQENPKLGVQYLTEKIDYTENPPVVLYLIASMSAQSNNDNDRALSFMQEGLTQYPEDAIVLNGLGYVIADLEIEKLYDEAEKYINKALEKDPANMMYWDSLAWLYHRQGKHQGAIEIMEKHCNENVVDSAIAYHFAVLYLETMQLDKAKLYLMLTIQNNNDETSVKAAEELYNQHFNIEKK